jgi:hypothetical protein
METKRIYNKSIKQSWFFEKINKIDNCLAKLTKRMEKTQINNKRWKRAITTGTNDIHKIIMEYFENFYSNKLDNLEKWINF